MLDVLLATCASSPERTTSVPLVSSPNVFNFETVCLWAGPLFEQVQGRLVYKGPLSLHCSCGYEHTPFIGLSEDDTFRTSSAFGFGTEFWSSCVYDSSLERSFVSLRAGDQTDLTPLGVSLLLSPSLASCLSSLRSVCEAWKAGTLTRSMLADVTTSGYVSAFCDGSSVLSSARSSLRSLVSSVGASYGRPSIISLSTRSRSP